MKESNHTIDELKQEYEQIPVSPHAKERILAGIAQGKASVKVLTTESKWFGVTYSQDRQGVVDKFAELHATGVYPEKMF